MGLVERGITSYIDSITEDREPDGLLHPSSISLCDRRAVYASRDDGTYSETFDDKTKRKFYIGHRLHEVVQRSLELNPEVDTFYAEPEINVPSHNLKGNADGVLFLDDLSVEVLEVKSISKGSLRYGGMPKEHHLVQAGYYAWGIEQTGFTYDAHGIEATVSPIKIDNIRFVYLEKENMDVYEYVVPFTDDMRKEIGDKLTDLNEYIADGDALPPRLRLTASGKKPWPCNYCPFAEKCWRTDPAEIPLKELF